MKPVLSQEAMAARAVKEFKDGDYINLGFGLPNSCASLVPPEKDVFFHAEHGVLGYGRLLLPHESDKMDFDLVDAGLSFFQSKPGLCWFDMATSFDMIRGGHLDATVLGGLEVSEKGDLANWTRGSATAAGIGGSMDLAVGARRVIVIMNHTTKNKEPRIVKQCKFPLTAKGCVNLIITDLAVIEVGREGLILKEYAPGWQVEEIQSLTEPKLIIADDVSAVQI